MSGAVAAVGDNTIDCYAGRDSYSYVGGNAVNVAVQLTRLGRPAGYFGAVGPDAAWQQIRDTLARAGVDVAGVVVRPGRTSTSRIRVSQDGARHFEAEDFGVCDGYRPDAAALERIAGCAAAHIGLMPGAEPVRSYLADRGVLVSQDCGVTLPVGGYRWMGIAFCSEEAAGRPAERIAHDAVAGGAALAVVTRGADGSLAFDGRTWWRTRAKPAEVVDTTGAGDAFAAGFLDARLHGADVDQAMTAGARHAALACGYIGAWPQAPGPAPPVTAG
ncbi:MAG: PfkB family carbohydrate kinase [Streptosporangiaceae bacterium]